MAAFAYVDQNFLSKCADDLAWKAEVIRAAAEGRVILVLSPVHFYEFGNVDTHERRERLLTLVDEAKPAWAFERVDMLVGEFAFAWCQMFGDRIPDFASVQPFAQVAASFANTRIQTLQNVGIRDFVASFVPHENLAALRSTFVDQAATVRFNGDAYRAGRFTKQIMQAVDRKHIACQFARLEGLKELQELLKRAHVLLSLEPLRTMIGVFVYWGGVKSLRTWLVECFLSELNHRRGGGLSANSFVDRQHATVAMPSCDMFVTDDEKLLKRCRVMKEEMNIKLATVLSCNEFIDLLKTG